MKLSIFKISIYCAIVTLVGCKKEPATTPSATNTQATGKLGEDYIPDLTDCYSGVELDGGYIRFDDISSLQSCLQCLEDKTDEMEQEFLNDYGHLNDSLLNKAEDSISYDELAVYEKFEDNFNVSSLRAYLRNQEKLWIDASPFDTSSSSIPDHAIGDYEFQTVISEEGVFLLADTIYLVNSAGAYYRILNNDFDVLDSMLTGIWTGPNGNVELNIPSGIGSRSSCKATRSTGWKWEYSTNHNGKYGMKYKSGFYNVWPVVAWYSKTQSRKRRNGKYRKWRTSVGAGMNGTRYKRDNSGGCGGAHGTYVLGTTKYRRTYTLRLSDWPPANSSRWKSCGHTGTHSTSKVSQKSRCANW